MISRVVYQVTKPDGEAWGEEVYTNYPKAQKAMASFWLPHDVQQHLGWADIENLCGAYRAAGYSIKELIVEDKL